MKSLLVICLCLAVAQSLAKQLPSKSRSRKVVDTPSQYALDRARLPINVAVLEGSTVILQCAVEAPSTSHSIQWIEYAHNPNGAPISDNEFIGAHPEAARYTIIHRDNWEYSLQISPVVIGDGGSYLCQDAQANPASEKRQHTISLTVVAAELNCTSTIRASGVVLDLSYQTNDCTLNYKGGLIPNLTWSGIGPFTQLQVATPTTAWAGMAFNVTRAMDTRAHQCTVHFTGYFLPVDANTADNVPSYTRTHQSRQMFVYWGPTNVTSSPMKIKYDAGDVLTCTADAFPLPTFVWQNLRTNQITNGATVRVDESWRGFNQTMRCEARNTIEGTIYSQNLFIPATYCLLLSPQPPLFLPPPLRPRPSPRVSTSRARGFLPLPPRPRCAFASI